MANEPAEYGRILELFWVCVQTHAMMKSGNCGPYLAAAQELLALHIPNELPPDPRLPEQIARVSPVRRVSGVLYDAGNVLIEIHRDEEAIPFLERVIEMTPDDADAYRELAVALERTGRVRQALEHYRIYAQLRPTDPDGFCGIGDCLMALLGEFTWDRSQGPRPDFTVAELVEAPGGPLEAYRAAQRVAPDAPIVLERFENLRRSGLIG